MRFSLSFALTLQALVFQLIPTMQKSRQLGHCLQKAASWPVDTCIPVALTTPDQASTVAAHSGKMPRSFKLHRSPAEAGPNPCFGLGRQRFGLGRRGLALADEGLALAGEDLPLADERRFVPGR